MSSHKPITSEALLGIKGVGEAKLEKYGSLFLAAIRKYQADQPGG